MEPSEGQAVRGLDRSRRQVLGEVLARSARREPDKVALVFEGETRTFGELDRRVNQLANALAARGVEQGARVAILMPNGIPVIESYLACAKVGAWAVPLNFRLAPPEVAYIVQDSGSCGIVSDGSLAATAQPAAAGLRFHLSTGD